MPTVLHRLSRWADEKPAMVAQRYKRNGEWRPITAAEFRDRVYHLALFLESRGITPNEISAILAYNSPEWVHLDLAMLLLGAKSAGIYPNSSMKDIHYILNHTQAGVLGVQDKAYFRKITTPHTAGEAEEKLPEAIQLIIVFDGDTSISAKAVAYEAAIAEGRALASRPGAKKFEDYLAKIDPKAPAFMIYTSGTTGNPKGALLSHDNLAFTATLAAKTWKLPFETGSLFSFLPLCHIAEKLQNVGVGITQRYAVSFCTKFDNVSTELPEAAPTLLLCVPRLWEKMMEGVMNKVERGHGLKKRLAIWALGVGERVASAKYSGKSPNPVDLLERPIADKLVLSKIREALGLKNAEILASGAAALPAHVSKWFRSLGLEILEDFGQTESTGVICMTEPGVESAGTVGRPVPGIDVKIADDGEICTRGRHVFVGYFKNPEATRDTIDAEGWLRTGDLAEMTERGLIRIRGRKKEIMKTSGGKMIAPLPIEETLKEASLISQACMVGDGRKYLAVLVTLSDDARLQAQQKGAVAGKLITSGEYVEAVRREIDRVNSQLASYEQIKKFAILSNEFSVEDGEMTPTLKMKRNVIETRYRDVIDSLYA